MMNFTPEMIEKAKAANSPEELLELAKEHDITLTEEEASAYYAQLSPKMGELTDDDLENVSGGGCYKKDRLVVTALRLCGNWRCKNCYNSYNRTRSGPAVLSSMEEYNRDTWSHTHISAAGGGSIIANCTNCAHCTYEGGLWLCNHPDWCK